LEILDIKAQNNLKVAELAVKGEYYDAAVSRYYYYIFLRIMIALNKKGIEPDNIDGLSHSMTISNFIKMCKEEGIYYNKRRSLAKLWRLKEKRTISEYSSNKIILTEDRFQQTFFNDYIEVVSVLKNLNFIGE
jgi:uncharacterized protein (UPF0332 family)